MEEAPQEILVKISSTGTISLPKLYRKYMDLQKGDYVRVVLNSDGLSVKKATIT